MIRRALRAMGWWLMSGALDRLAADSRFSAIASGPGADSRSAQDAAQASELLASLQVIRENTALQKELSGTFFEDLLVAEQLHRHGPKLIFKENSGVFSQGYEDSVIAEIYSRIGAASKIFVEIGVETGKENTTRLLLALGWKGAWIEANPQYVVQIRENFAREIDEGRLVVREALASAENIQPLLDLLELGGEIDFMSIDIDQNTSHIWRALTTRPRVACIEYNAHFHPSVEFEVPYRLDATWNGSNIFGASLKALERIGRQKAMSLVGCDLLGVNAYFVADELLGDHFATPYTAEKHYQPPRYPMVSTRRGHPSA